MSDRCGGRGAGELLAEARAAGLSVSLDGGRLVVRGPKAAEGLGRELLGRKAEVVSVLLAEAAPLVVPPPVERPSGGWDQARADAVLAEALALADAAEPRATGAQRRILEVTRAVVRRRHERRDPLLWAALFEVGRQLARWRAGAATVTPADGG